MKKETKINNNSYYLKLTSIICFTIIAFISVIAFAWGNMGLKILFSILGITIFIMIFSWLTN